MLRRIVFAGLVLAGTGWSQATCAAGAYLCTTKQVMELSNRGVMEKDTGIYKSLVGTGFTINRETGEVIGEPFDTRYYDQVTVLDKGSRENSYKAIATSPPPNVWVMYIYVAEHHRGSAKPFWGTDSGNKIFSGVCH